ncbi:unnamed protein product [Toxocara canis]|uniref:Gamma-soluble NSF attachment protein n=1 Tax=Toxocara canis TaxID=6265 RepID=A0A183UN57_TOXCA|nr:unnamed protein product [Toxocara canis]
MFAEIDEYLEEYEGDKAYEAAKKLMMGGQFDEVGLCYRLAQACYIRSNNCYKNVEQRKAILSEAHEACKKAYELDARNANVLKWCSIVTGSLAEITNGREKIELGCEFKGYLDEAMKVAPDSSIYHMRGRFAYEVASMSQMEREASTAMLGTSPSFSYDGALENLFKAEELNPGELENLLYIAKCFLAKGKNLEAYHYLMRMNANIAVDEADEMMLVEAKNLLNIISSNGFEIEKQSTKENSVIGSDEEEEDERLSVSIEEADRSDNGEMPCA